MTSRATHFFHERRDGRAGDLASSPPLGLLLPAAAALHCLLTDRLYRDVSVARSGAALRLLPDYPRPRRCYMLVSPMSPSRSRVYNTYLQNAIRHEFF